MIGMEKVEKSSKLGRPREFDADEALGRALEVFWAKGYEGASLQDLTDAMGISRPSLYAAFGNKESLFRKALDRYIQGPGSLQERALAEPTARKVVETLLRGAACTDSCNPAGCLLVQGALACGDDADCVRKELVARRTAGQKALWERFERAQAEGDLRPDIDTCALSKYISAILYGMAVMAAGGASGEDLNQVVHVALEAWPG